MSHNNQVCSELLSTDDIFRKTWFAAQELVGSHGERLISEGWEDTPAMLFVNSTILQLNEIGTTYGTECKGIIMSITPETVPDESNIQDILNTSFKIKELNVEVIHIAENFEKKLAAKKQS